MTRYAVLNENGVVTNIAKASPDYAARKGWVDALDAGLGYRWDGERFWTPEEDALEALAAKRWQAIQNNFSLNGQSITLDDRTQSRIANAIAGLERKPTGATVSWEVSRGVFVSMDLPTLQAFGDAAFDHVQACFAHSETIAAQIKAGETYDLEAGWPS